MRERRECHGIKEEEECHGAREDEEWRGVRVGRGAEWGEGRG